MPEPLPPLAIGASEVHDMHSEAAGADYRLFVGECLTNPTSLLVVLDGNGFFGAAVDTVRSLQLMRMVPRTLVVGVGYPDVVGLADSIPQRSRDLTPTNHAFFPTSGGGEAFGSFLADQLLPWVRSGWPTIDHTILFGHSLGGSFGCHLLLAGGNPFDAYVLSSPSLWWDDEAIFDVEQTLAELGTSLRATVYTAIGSLEDVAGRKKEAIRLPETHPVKPRFDDSLDMVADLDRFVAQLRSRNHPELDLAHEVIADEFHTSVGPISLSRGLRYIHRTPE